MTAPLAVTLVLGCQGYGGASCSHPAELCVLVGSAERHRVQCIGCFSRGKARGDHYAVHGQDLDTWVEARFTQRVPARAPRVDPTMIMALQALVERPAAEPVEPVTIEPVIVEPGPVAPVIVEPVIIPTPNPDPTPETPVTETRTCKWPSCEEQLRNGRFCKTHYRKLGSLYGGVTGITDEQFAAAPAAWDARIAAWKGRAAAGEAEVVTVVAVPTITRPLSWLTEQMGGAAEPAPAGVSDLETPANPLPVGPCDERCAESCFMKVVSRRELAEECLDAVEALLTREDHWHLPGDATGSIQAYVSWLHGQVDTMGEARRVAVQRAETAEAALDLAREGRANAMAMRDLAESEIAAALEDDRLRAGEEKEPPALLGEMLKRRLARLRLEVAMAREALPALRRALDERSFVLTEVDLRRRARLLAESDDLRARALALEASR